MRRFLAVVAAIAGGLVIAFGATLILAEVVRTFIGPYFTEVDWPVWFPTTPIYIAIALLWWFIGRALWRLLRASRATGKN